MKESSAFKTNGFLALAAIIAIAFLGILLAFPLIAIANTNSWEYLGPTEILGVLLIALSLIGILGLVAIEPNQALALVFFGNYIGTAREAGFWWVNPLAEKMPISLRVRNFNSDKLKVNDACGNPIEIAAVVVWRAIDTAKALFDVDDYEEFVGIQSETAIRALAIRYPYDTNEEDKSSLRGATLEVAGVLQEEVQDRLQIAGVEVLESRISYLAYAPEIAQVMLRRQQAEAIIAARRQIIEGALSMVEMTLNRLSDRDTLVLDDATKAAMVNNLLVVLTAEQNIQPMINTGLSQSS
jgi:hypothetical protein